MYMDLLTGAPFADSEGAPALHAIGVLELLERDSRPTFILDRSRVTDSSKASTSLAYWNDALAIVGNGELLQSLKAEDITAITEKQRPVRSEFDAWLLTQEFTKSCTFRGYRWTKFLLAKRWIVIVGLQLETSAHGRKPESNGNVVTNDVSHVTVAAWDWTSECSPTKISPYVAWVRSIDWSQTSMGRMSQWSPQLRSFANLLMQDPKPAILLYGSDLTILYNEAYAGLIGSLHPCIGLNARTVFASVWSESFEPMIAQNLNGETITQNDMVIHVNRRGFLEETYFSIKVIPILDADGITVGHYEPLAETTQEVISRRQSQTLLQLSEEIPRARDIKSYWALATEVFARNDKDILFVLLYSVECDSKEPIFNATRLSGGNRQLRLQGSVGLPANSPAAPVYLDLNGNAGFAPYLRQAMTAQEPTIITFDEDPAAAALLHNFVWRGFGDPCRAAAVCSLSPTSSKDNILGFMVVGLNPRRPYDNDYRHFISIVSRMLSTSLTSILLHEEDISRRERTIANAEAMRLELKRQLLNTQREAERSIFKFQRFAEGADIGIFVLGLNGVYSYRNHAWFSILGAGDQNIELDLSWERLIDDEYIPIGQAKFQALIDTKQHQKFELRLKRTSLESIGDSEPQKQPMWILCSIFPDMKGNGELEAMIGCFTDISRQKLGEKVQATHALNAQESKRQLESFIDTTSHEMRNPLSAIIQSADDIISIHQTFKTSTKERQTHQRIIEDTVDAADTIVQCSKHMKKIVDDVLTMSKLDSGLFTMTPVDVQLDSIARSAVNMFESEARSAGIELKFLLDESCRALGVDIVSLDSTRVLQILINLVTNAIKFTRLEKTRWVTVSLSVAGERPLQYAQGQLQFVRTSETREVPSLRADWDRGNSVYVVFAVKDTGRGLSESESDLLFARFSQASPRTHVDYGGSGLGLFISRRLTEMHGGAIGFASKAGMGSTFAFYVRARNATSLRRKSADSTEAPRLSIRNQAHHFPERSRNDTDGSLADLADNEVAASDLQVLIVEDNIVNQRVLAKQLRNIGVHVTVANHGGQALDHLRTTTYWKSEEAQPNKLSLILMDWEMPVMDGLTCVRRIREMEIKGALHGHVPVIAVTANVRAEQIEVAMTAGMDNVISKPFRIPELWACMQRTLTAVART